MHIIIIYPYLSLKESDENLSYERSVREQFLANELIKQNINIELWFLTKKKDAFSFNNLPGRPCYFPIDATPKYNSFKWCTSESLKQTLISRNPDIVFFKGMGFYLPYWLYKTKSLPNNIGFIVGGNYFDILIPIASYIFTEFDYQTIKIFKSFYKTNRCSKLNKYIPDNDFIRNSDKQFDIISIGDLSRRKNHKALLPLAKDFKIKIIGDGPLRKELEDFFKSYNNNITLLGSIKRDEIAEHISSAKLMVHPSLSEGFPRVFAESFACGVPVIAIKKAIKGEFPNNILGKLVSKEAITYEVRALLKDDHRLKQYSNNCIEYSDINFRSTIILNQFLNGINDIKKKRNNSIYTFNNFILLQFRFLYWHIDFILYKYLSQLKRNIFNIIKGNKL